MMNRKSLSVALLSTALAFAAMLAVSMTGCTNGTGTGGSAAKPGATAKIAPGETIAVGFIYVGPKDDYGYNQAHAQGAAAVKKMDGVKISEEENVKETVDVQKTMKSMIEQDGAKVLFPTSFGYFDPHIL